MKKLADMLFHLLKIAAALCLAAMVVLVFSNVVLRYAFNSGLSVAEELSSWCLTWMTYIAGLVALRDHGHLGFDSIVTRLPPMLQRACFALSQLLMIALAALFLQGSWLQTAINLGNAAPASGISLGMLYGVGVLFSVVAILVLLNDLYRTLTGKIGAGELVMSEAGEALAEIERTAHDAKAAS